MNSQRQSDTRPTHILVVDDEVQVLAVAKAILEAHGFLVSIAKSGEAALEILQQQAEGSELNIDVVVLDLSMPGGMSGFEVLERMRKQTRELPIVACSGYFQDNAQEMCQAIGFSDILPKPYTFDQLVASVRRCLAGEGQFQANF
jgi:CheY-like chemotaxis protein